MVPKACRYRYYLDLVPLDLSSLLERKSGLVSSWGIGVEVPYILFEHFLRHILEQNTFEKE